MVISAGMWSILGSLFEKMLMLATYAIVSREADPIEFGFLVLVLLIIELMGYIAGFGVGENIVRKKDLTDRFMSSSFYFVCYVSLVLIACMFVFVAPISYLVSGENLALLVILMALYPALTTFSGFYIAILQRDMRFKEIAYRTAVISIFSGSVGVMSALSGFGVFSLIVARYVYSIADVVILKHLTKFEVVTSPDRKQLIQIWKFGWKLSASQLLNFSSSRIYEIFVIALFGPIYLAILDVGRKLLLTLYRVVLTPLNSVCLSHLSKADNPTKSYLTFTTIVNLLIVPIVAIMGGVSEHVVLLLFGDQWVAASEVLKLLSIGVIAQASTWFLPSLAISKGKTGVVFIMNIIQVTVLFIFGCTAYVASLNFDQLIWCLIIGLFVSTFLRISYLRISMGFPTLQFILLLFLSTIVYLFFLVVSEYILGFSLEFIAGYWNNILYINIFALIPVGMVFIVYLGFLYLINKTLMQRVSIS